MKYIEIAGTKTAANEYHVTVDICNSGLNQQINMRMTRDEIKNLRNMMHNALLDLNEDLNYE